MKNKPLLNWGSGIAIVYSVFLILAIGSAIFTMNLDYFLVSDDYYQKGIEYQDQIDKINRTNQLNQSVTWQYDKKSQNVIFNYPKELTSGKIIFYRPANSNLDRFVKIELDEFNQQTINMRNWAKGYWKIKVEWEAHKNSYYNEGTVDIK